MSNTKSTKELDKEKKAIIEANKISEQLTKDFYTLAGIALKDEGAEKGDYDTKSILEVVKSKKIVNVINDNADLQDYTKMFKILTPAVLERVARNAMTGSSKDVELFFRLHWGWSPPKEEEIRAKFMGIIRKISMVIEKHVPASAKTIKFKEAMEAIYQEIENE